MPQTPLASSGRLIRDERERRGLTQTELADAAGVSQATLSRIEVAGGGRAETLNKLATALDLNVSALLCPTAAIA
jgi:transcriptional regulator with XRE-family HTH domain